ncbi:MAG: preprotein translocase subunit SecG [Oceanicaulis sp.]
MSAVLLIIQFLVAIALTAVILMQRSEGGALGIGGGGPGGMMSGRGAANLLTRTTMVLGAVFIANSILLAVLSGVDTTNRSVIERAGETQTDDDLPFDLDQIPGDDAPALDEPVTDAPDTPAEPAEDGPPAELPNR